MSNDVVKYEGFQELTNILKNYIKQVDNVVDILEVGAKEFVNDALKLPKPFSKIRKTGYTHLVRSFSYRKKKNEVEAGWGKYYGPMQEKGTDKMNAQPHMYPLWDKNKEKYYKKMLTKLGLKNW